MFKKGLLVGIGTIVFGMNVVIYGGEMEAIVKDNTVNSGFSVKEETANSTIARFRGDGMVGIGTANPTEKLEVVGNVKATRFIGDGSGLTGILSGSPSQWTTSGTNISYTAGNVGIGTTSPGALPHTYSLSASVANRVETALSTGYAYTQYKNPDTTGDFFIGKEGSAGSGLLTGDIGNAGILTMAGNLPIQFGTNNIPRITILGGGNVGIGTIVPGHPLHMASGAHVTAGGVWTNASSREYKENIRDLTVDEARAALDGLRPTRFNYKTDKEDEYVGFIAEDAPELVATKDRKGLSPMDLTAVLTKVVQEQQEAMKAMAQKIQMLDQVVRNGLKGR